MFYDCTSLAFVLWDGNAPQELPQEVPLDNTDIFEGCSGLQKLVVCDDYAEAYKSRFNSYSGKVEKLSTFISNALTEIPDAQKAASDVLTEQDETLLQNYLSAIASATLPSVAFTNKKCALGIINLRPTKNTILTEIEWNLYEHKGILTEEDKASIAGYVDVIELATDEETLAKARQSALNVIYLREAKTNTMAEINALDAIYRGIDFNTYKDAVTNATSADEVNSILGAVNAIIENGTFATIGSLKYLLNNEAGECRYNGSITFTDKEVYQSDYGFTVTDSITYNRTFKDRNWQALYVPFSIGYNEWMGKFDVATINNFHEYTDADGKTIKTELEVRLVKSGYLKPNTPYLIRVNNPNEYDVKPIQLSTNKIYQSETKSIDCSSVESKYTFTGTYHKMTGLNTKDCIFMSGGKLCKAENDEIALSPQRWYLTVEPRGSLIDEGGQFLAKAMEFDIKLLDDESTGIQNHQPSTLNPQPSLYNLSGVRVGKDYKGIVIKNGKKVYQK